ncbi:hypothetical protein QBC47DRAFT_117776 [Echria macrotheca]|uniref:Uncharacterized protein n=1 Tax=Echria macrotheca TaxID=438768 RepID=A0AAJ0FAC9_9PEZI|nr:hypothetical protein QBC47DRAFT_117776 [Echria macrotheca]
MGQPPPPADENLPEVVQHQPLPLEKVPDSSPHVLSPREASEKNWQTTTGEKYPVVFDTTPKLPHASHADNPQLWSGGEPTPTVTQTDVSPWDTLPAGSDAATRIETGGEQPGKDQKKICGLRRRTFIIVVIIAVVVVAAAIGGGVGGTRNRGGPPEPRFLNNQTAPVGLAFQGFSGTSYQGNATTIIQDEGFHDLDMEALSYVWLPDGTQCCLTFCEGPKNATGYWCDPRFRTAASSPFNRVYIWCGGDNGVKNVTCS